MVQIGGKSNGEEQVAQTKRLGRKRAAPGNGELDRSCNDTQMDEECQQIYVHDLAQKPLRLDDRANLPELIAISSPTVDKIACVPASDITTFIKNDEKIQKIGAYAAENRPRYKPKPNELCLARYKVGEKYEHYRCAYVKDLNMDRAAVYCIDYAKFIYVSANDIRVSFDVLNYYKSSDSFLSFSST